MSDHVCELAIAKRAHRPGILLRLGWVVAHCLMLPVMIWASDRVPDKDVADSLQAVFENAPDTIDHKVFAEGNLDSYLREAALRNPGLRAAFYDWMAALAKTHYAGSLPDPTVAYAYFASPVETRLGPQNQKISLKQKFPWFGVLDAAKDEAVAAANAAYQKYEAKRLLLFYRIKSAYAKFYLLGQKIDLTREDFELLNSWESVVRTKYKVSLSRHADMIKAQVELGILEERLLSLEHQTLSFSAVLMGALDSHGGETLPIPDTLGDHEGSIPLEGAIASALLINPDLKAMGFITQQHEAGVRNARRSARPNFTFGVDYIEIGESIFAPFDQAGKDALSVNVAFNLPIWFGKNGARTKAARARHRAAEYRRAEYSNRLRTKVEETHFGFEDALRKLRLYRDGLVPKAEQSLGAAYTAYQSGSLDFLTLLDAQKSLLSVRLKREQALTDLFMRRAHLEMLTGREWTDADVSPASGE